MIERFIRPEMGRIWSEDNKYRQWPDVELAAARRAGAEEASRLLHYIRQASELIEKAVVELSVY